MIVVVLPSRQNGSCVLERREFGDVQALIAEPAVKGLDQPVFHRLARSDEVELYTASPRPFVERRAR